MADENGGGVVEEQVTTPNEGQVDYQAELAKYKAKVKEMRDNNVNLMKERESFQEQLKKIDEYKSQLAEKDRALMEAKGDVEGIYKSQIEELKSNYEKRIEALNSKAKEFETKAEQFAREKKDILFRYRVSKAALSDKIGADPNYIDYIIGDASGIFEIDDDGEIIARNGMIDTETGDEWTIETWMSKHRDKRPGLYKGSTGSGAIGGTFRGGKRVITQHQFSHELAKDPQMKADFLAGKIIVQDEINQVSSLVGDRATAGGRNNNNNTGRCFLANGYYSEY